MADSMKSLANEEQFTKNFNKLKHDLEVYREAVLLANTVLKWDKPAFGGIVAGTVTVAYILIWFLDLSVLTLVALLALTAVVLDYAYPIVSRMVFRADAWSGTQEKRYEQVCRELCSLKMCVCCVARAVCVGKEEKSTKYYVSTVIALIVCAYIGAIVDNLLLCYLTTMLIALYPGLQKHGFVQAAQAKVCALVGNHLSFLKQKVVSAATGGSTTSSGSADDGKKKE